MTTNTIEFGWAIHPAAIQWAECEQLLEHNRQFKDAKIFVLRSLRFCVFA